MLISGKSLALMLGTLLVAATLAVLYVPDNRHTPSNPPQRPQKARSYCGEDPKEEAATQAM